MPLPFVTSVGEQIEIEAGSIPADDSSSRFLRDRLFWGAEGLIQPGKVVGWVTSGGYAHHVNKSVAMGYVPAALAEETNGFEVEIIGKRKTPTCPTTVS